MTDIRAISERYAPFPVHEDPDEPPGGHPQAFGLNQLHSFGGEDCLRQFPDLLLIFLNVLFHKNPCNVSAKLFLRPLRTIYIGSVKNTHFRKKKWAHAHSSKEPIDDFGARLTQTDAQCKKKMGVSED
jgi:hypothetical protein